MLLDSLKAVYLVGVVIALIEYSLRIHRNQEWHTLREPEVSWTWAIAIVLWPVALPLQIIEKRRGK